MKRLFIALWPDEKTRRLLHQFNRNLLIPGCKPMNPANFHVTLVFIGNVADQKARDIADRLMDMSARPLQLIFDELSYWRKPKILCLTCSHPDPEVMQLAQSLTEIIEDFEVVLDTRPFCPHVTLARHVYDKPEVDFKPIVWQADSYCLVESVTQPQGPYYKVIHRYHFCKS
jgi:RNA 2',3'-cyclic 3'-phosphodiesterase